MKTLYLFYLVLLALACLSVNLLAEEDYSTDIEGFLLRVKEITDEANPAMEEKMAIMSIQSGGRCDAATIDSLIARNRKAVEDLEGLVPPEEGKKVKQLGIEFYSANLQMFQAYKQMNEGLPTSVDPQQLQLKVSMVGIQLDNERKVLHNKYSLGEL